MPRSSSLLFALPTFVLFGSQAALAAPDETPPAEPAQPVLQAAPDETAGTPPAEPSAPPPEPVKGDDAGEVAPEPPTPPTPGKPLLEPRAAALPRVSSPAKLPTPPALAGWHNGFFVRDRTDAFVLYPRGRLQLDLHTWPGAPPSQPGATSLVPRVHLRRARVELAGEVLRRWAFVAAFDVTSTPVANDDFTPAEGANPADAASYVVLSQAYVAYSVIPAFQLKAGQMPTPFGIENQTDPGEVALLERAMPIRGFAVTSPNEVGLSAYGDVLDRRVSYELGVYLGDGQNRFVADDNPDLAARVFTRPFAKEKKSPLRGLQLGASGRVGWRAQRDVSYRLPAVRSGQGIALWDGSYTDRFDRTVVTIPSGTQGAVGGELRLPIDRFELRGEGYWVLHQTREAVEGVEQTTTERLGTMEGAAWYAQAAVWIGDEHVPGAPGNYGRPRSIDLSKAPDKTARALELTILAGGVHAKVLGASRGGTPDAATPGSPGGPTGALDVVQLAGAASYWHTRSIRLSVNYAAYVAPSSGTKANLARLPSDGSGAAPVLHELAARAQLTF